MDDALEILLLQLNESDENNFKSLRRHIILQVDYLINTDFAKLVFILYKVDVDENKLKSLLAAPADTASVIADLIIERQLQKIRSKAGFKMNNATSDEEIW